MLIQAVYASFMKTFSEIGPVVLAQLHDKQTDKQPQTNYSRDSDLRN